MEKHKCNVCGFESDDREDFYEIIGQRYRQTIIAKEFGDKVIAVCYPCWLKAMGVKPHTAEFIENEKKANPRHEILDVEDIKRYCPPLIPGCPNDIKMRTPDEN